MASEFHSDNWWLGVCATIFATETMQDFNQVTFLLLRALAVTGKTVHNDGTELGVLAATDCAAL